MTVPIHGIVICMCGYEYEPQPTFSELVPESITSNILFIEKYKFEI